MVFLLVYVNLDVNLEKDQVDEVSYTFDRVDEALIMVYIVILFRGVSRIGGLFCQMIYPPKIQQSKSTLIYLTLKYE